MASYNELNALIDAYINRNGVQAITGQILNGVLKAMVEQLGRGYTIMGAATPTTDPGTPDGPECYFASETGTYTDFDGLQIIPGELALLCYTPSDGWTKATIYEGFQTVRATADDNIGYPQVGVSYANGILSFDFRNIKGEPGENGQDGDPAGFGTVNATVDDQVGTPSVSVSSSGPDTAKNFTFAFRNLKGETGVTSVLATVDNTSGNPQCAVSLNGQQLVLNFTGLKGDQGDTGSSVDYPFTIVNNLTTNDATQALSAAMGVQLESEVSQLEAEINGVAIIEKGYSWSNGYVGYTSGIYKVVTSSISRFCQPIKFKEGEKLTYKTGSDYTYAVVQVNDGTPIASGDTISYLQTLISATVANQQYEYTFPSDMWVVISIYSLDYTLGVYKYDSNSISKQISDIEAEVTDLESTKLSVSYSTNSGYISPAGTPTASTHYDYTSPIAIKQGQTLFVDTAGYAFCVISKYNNGTYEPLVNISSGDLDIPKEYSYKANEDCYLVACYKNDGNSYSVKKSWVAYDNSIEIKELSIETKELSNLLFTPKFSQGSVRASVPVYSNDIYVDSTLAIHTTLMPYNDIAKVEYDSTLHDVWAFYYADDYSFISYAQVIGKTLPSVSGCQYVIFAINNTPQGGGNIKPGDIDAYTDFFITKKVYEIGRGVDAIPTEKSTKFVESGGVFERFKNAENTIPYFSQGTIAAYVPYNSPNLVANSAKAVHTFGIPYENISGFIFDDSVYTLWGFYYDKDFGFLSYAQITDKKMPNVSGCRYVVLTMGRVDQDDLSADSVQGILKVELVNTRKIAEEIFTNSNLTLSPLFSQGTVAANYPAYSDNIYVSSPLAIHTSLMPYNDIARVEYDSTEHDVWAFYYAADYSFISYAKLTGPVLPVISGCQYVIFAMNNTPQGGGNITPSDIDVYTDFVITRKVYATTSDIPSDAITVDKLFSDKLYKQTYSGGRITIFDDNTVKYSREQFSTIPFESVRHQSFAVYGEYILFLFHETMVGALYHITENKKVCDITFPLDSTYGSSHNNACCFGGVKFAESDDFPAFYISQFNGGTGSYLVYRLQKDDDIYKAKLSQIVTANSSLKEDADFGLGYGDWCVDKDNGNLYHLGYAGEGVAGTIKLSKFTLPALSDGEDFASSTGDTIKVVTLESSDILDHYEIGEVGLQDNCCYNGHIIISGWNYWAFINLETKTTRFILSQTGTGYDEAEGVDVYMNKMLVTYWGQQGLFKITF